jgi:hypothetical protein
MYYLYVYWLLDFHFRTAPQSDVNWSSDEEFSSDNEDEEDEKDLK